MRKQLFDYFNIIMALLEGIGLYFLLMFITKSTLLTSIILGIIYLFVLLCVIAVFSVKTLAKEEHLTKDENLIFLKNKIELTLKRDYDFKGNLYFTDKPLVQSSAYSQYNDIYVSTEDIKAGLLQDELGTLNHNIFWSAIGHELGHVVSGIVSAKTPAFRLSTFIVNVLRIKCEQLSIDKKWYYYPLSIIHNLLCLINLNFIFLRNDEHFANKFAIENNMGSHMLALYNQERKNDLHDLYHPTEKVVTKKLVKYYNHFENTEIYYLNEHLFYKINEQNLNDLVSLGNENKHLALYELGFLHYNGFYLFDVDKEKGLHYIERAYKLGNLRALKFLLTVDESRLNDSDLLIDLDNEQQFDYLTNNDLYEFMFKEIYENYNLEIEENLQIIIDAHKCGNAYATKVYIQYLLDYYTYPMLAFQAYLNFIDVYSNLFNLDEVIQIIFEFMYHTEYSLFVDEVMPDLVYIESLITNNKINSSEYFWSYLYYVSTQKSYTKYHDLFLDIIRKIIQDEKINKDSIQIPIFKDLLNLIEN